MDVIAVMAKNLQATKMIAECMKNNKPLYDSKHTSDMKEDILERNINYRLNATEGRRGELLKNPAYVEVLDKYR